VVSLQPRGHCSTTPPARTRARFSRCGWHSCTTSHVLCGTYVAAHTRPPLHADCTHDWNMGSSDGLIMCTAEPEQLRPSSHPPTHPATHSANSRTATYYRAARACRVLLNVLNHAPRGQCVHVPDESKCGAALHSYSDPRELCLSTPQATCPRQPVNASPCASRG
jgi:hypothetical protein